MTVFESLNGVNVNGHVEKKNGLSYLSWAWAWAELLKKYPDSTYTIYENKDGWFYHTDGKTCWVKTGVTVEGKEYIEMLPVMDYKNRSIPAENVTSFDVNKAIQRSLTKAVARHGLGLYIYAGEDLPEGEDQEQPKEKTEPVQATKVKSMKILKEKAMLAYGTEKAPERFELLMKQAGCTKETMNEYYYDQIDAWIESDLKKGVA